VQGSVLRKDEREKKGRSMTRPYESPDKNVGRTVRARTPALPGVKKLSRDRQECLSYENMKKEKERAQLGSAPTL